MIYITGDTHGQFDRLTSFCSKVKASKSDIMIILGDAGINYLEGARAEILKRQLSSLPIQLFCIHGNHENRPSNIPSYLWSPRRSNGKTAVWNRYKRKIRYMH